MERVETVWSFSQLGSAMGELNTYILWLAAEAYQGASSGVKCLRCGERDGQKGIRGAYYFKSSICIASSVVVPPLIEFGHVPGTFVAPSRVPAESSASTSWCAVEGVARICTLLRSVMTKWCHVFGHGLFEQLVRHMEAFERMIATQVVAGVGFELGNTKVWISVMTEQRRPSMR